MPGPDDSSNQDAPPGGDAAERLLDLLYTGVGLGVLAVNKAQVARRAATAEGGPLDGLQMPATLEGIQALMSDPSTAGTVLQWLQNEVKNVDTRLDGIENQVGEALDRLEPDLPEPARDLVQALRGLAADHATQVRAVLGLEN